VKVSQGLLGASLPVQHISVVRATDGRATPQSLVRAASGLSFIACVCAAAAFLREMVQASAFGAGANVDAYIVALTLPFLIGTTIVSTWESTVVPLYLACKAAGEPERAERFAGTTLGWTGVVGLTLSIGLVVWPDLVALQAPGFDDAQLALAGRLVWFTAPSVFFAALYAAGRSVLNAESRFFWPAIAPGVNAVVMMTVMIAGRASLGIGAVALSYTLGMAAMWITVQVPLIMANLPGRLPRWELRNPDVGRLPRAVGLLCVGVAAMSALPMVDRYMASRWPAGLISSLAYADRVVQIPVTIIVSAATTVAFPALSRFAAGQDYGGLRRTLAHGMELAVLMLAPILVLLLCFRQDVVTILFQRGAFTIAETEMTAVVLGGLAAGLLAMGAFQFVPRVFNALQLASFVSLSGFLNLGFKIIFNVILVPLLGPLGFALATSAMYLSTGVVMLWLLRRRLGGLSLHDARRGVTAALLASALMTASALSLAAFLDGAPPIVRLSIAGCVGAAVYGGAIWISGGRPGGWLAQRWSGV
jgi:putative peptidoglycan lipid II flippase